MTSDSNSIEVDVSKWIFGQSAQKPCSIDKAFAYYRVVDYDEKIPSWLGR